MIGRIWHGWTTPQNADAYARLLEGEIAAGILARRLPGLRGMDLLRRDDDDEVEFSTIMWFDSLDAVRGFAGEHFTTAVVPEAARRLLTRFDAHSYHYDVVRRHEADGNTGRSGRVPG